MRRMRRPSCAAMALAASSRSASGVGTNPIVISLRQQPFPQELGRIAGVSSPGARSRRPRDRATAPRRRREPESRDVAGPVASGYRECVVMPGDEIGQAAVRDLDALGRAGRTGRVDDVGQIGLVGFATGALADWVATCGASTSRVRLASGSAGRGTRGDHPGARASSSMKAGVPPDSGPSGRMRRPPSGCRAPRPPYRAIAGGRVQRGPPRRRRARVDDAPGGSLERFGRRTAGARPRPTSATTASGRSAARAAIRSGTRAMRAVAAAASSASVNLEERHASPLSEIKYGVRKPGRRSRVPWGRRVACVRTVPLPEFEPAGMRCHERPDVVSSRPDVVKPLGAFTVLARRSGNGPSSRGTRRATQRCAA